MMEYNGYLAEVQFDDQADLFHRTVKQLRQAFRESVEDYLAFCAARGEEPEKPFSGKFVVRISPQLHRKISIAAARQGKSLNAWVSERLTESRVAAGLPFAKSSNHQITKSPFPAKIKPSHAR